MASGRNERILKDSDLEKLEVRLVPLLQRYCLLPITEAEDKTQIEAGKALSGDLSGYPSLHAADPPPSLPSTKRPRPATASPS